jgi:hypothetical protein
MAKNWVKVGAILKGKTGGQYIKIDVREDRKQLDSITLKSGQTLSVFNPRKRPGITEEEVAKIPEYVLADILIGPDRE